MPSYLFTPLPLYPFTFLPDSPLTPQTLHLTNPYFSNFSDFSNFSNKLTQTTNLPDSSPKLITAILVVFKEVKAGAGG